MPHADKVKLLFGPYHPPRLHKDDKAFCLLRDCDVVITSWSDAPIPWPRCRAIGSRGGSGLLLNEELARAVRHESAAAIMHHWGVTAAVVWRWRQALGVSRYGTEGSRRLHQQLSEARADAVKQREFTEEEREQQRRRNKELNLARNLKTGYHGPLWTDEAIALLGAQPDAEVAKKIGKTTSAVRQKREELGIANAFAKPPGLGLPWSAEEDELVHTLPPAEAAQRLGRTVQAVYGRRHALGLGRRKKRK